MVLPRTTIDRPAPHAFTSVVADAAAFDPSGLSPVAGLRAAAGLVLVLAVGVAAGGPPAAAVAGTGALIAGIVSVTGGVRPPLVTMVITAIAQAVSIFVGAATGALPVLHIALLVGWAFAAALLVALSPGASIVGVQAIVGFVVFGRFAEAPAGSLRLAGLALAGAAVETAVTAVVRWPEALRAQRGHLATVYRDLAALARGGPDAPGTPAALAADAADTILSARSLLARDDGRALRGILDEGRRIRLALLSVSGLRRRLTAGTGAAEVDAALGDIAAALDDIAIALTGGDVDAAERSHALADQVSERAHELSHRDERSVLTDPSAGVIGSIAGQLRAVCGLLDEIHRSGRPHLQVPRRRRRRRGVVDRLRSDAEQLNANLTPRSAAFRHAARMAVLVPAALILGVHSPLARSYWIPMTVALVLRPDFAGTFSRGLARTLGTVVGVAVTGLAVAALHPGQAVRIVIIGVLAWGTYALFTASFAAAIACITGIVVLLVGLIQPATVGTAMDRLLDTVIGGAIALLAYAAWPTWSADEARAAMSHLVDAQRAYMSAVFERIAGAPSEGIDLGVLARDSRMARSNASAVVERSLREPARHRLDQEQAAGVLAALRRVSDALHLLRTQATGPRRQPVPWVRELTTGLDTAMTTIASALRATDDDERHALPPLRAMHDELRRNAGEGDAATLVVAETDELVDAIDTVGHLVGVEHEAHGTSEATPSLG